MLPNEIILHVFWNTEELVGGFYQINRPIRELILTQYSLSRWFPRVFDFNAPTIDFTALRHRIIEYLRILQIRPRDFRLRCHWIPMINHFVRNDYTDGVRFGLKYLRYLSVEPIVRYGYRFAGESTMRQIIRFATKYPHPEDPDQSEYLRLKCRKYHNKAAERAITGPILYFDPFNITTQDRLYEKIYYMLCQNGLQDHIIWLYLLSIKEDELNTLCNNIVFDLLYKAAEMNILELFIAIFKLSKHKQIYLSRKNKRDLFGIICDKNRRNILAYMIHHCAIDEIDYFYALHYCIIHGKGLAEYLMMMPNVKYRLHEHFIRACECNRVNIVKILLDIGAKPNKNEAAGLRAAARHGHLEVARLILDHRVVPIYIKKIIDMDLNENMTLLLESYL